ncbi:MAG: hypothetical protein JRG91_20845 [Deltaproteobacteria bacterium]|nr:hypothetical protein [Deltaproteobacteria bacterium]
MRLFASMLVLVLVACSTEFNKEGQDTGVDPGTEAPVDMAVEPATDTGMDTDIPDTEPPDAAPDPVDDPVVDTAMDSLTEPGIDSPTCPSLTYSAGGVCNIVEQCGCAYGEYCEYTVNDTTCIAWEICMTGSRGTLGIGEACDPSADPCSPGHICMHDTTGTPVCFRWCEVTTDCPTGYTCGPGPYFEPCGSVFLHGICMPD